ncbi:hypothetical protein [Halostagnicola bangensis]
MPHLFVYSDNILEGVRFIDNLDEHSDYLNLIGEDLSDPSQPKFILADSGGNEISLTVRGEYECWELPPHVDTAVSFIGRPDVVVVDREGEQVIGGEFTDAAPIGNMILQREGRQVGLLRAGFPLVYDTAYTATDRSGGTVDPRFPMAMIVLTRLAYCMKYRRPAFITFYKEPDGERAASQKYDDYPPIREHDEGKRYLHNYLSTQLLQHAHGEYQRKVEDSQRDILYQMTEYVLEKPVVRGKDRDRIEKDAEGIANTSVLLHQREAFIDHIIEVINGRETPNPDFDLTQFDSESAYNWNSSPHKSKPFNKAILDAGLTPQTFSSRQNPYVIDTDEMIDAVTHRYPALSSSLNSLDRSIETVVITPKFFQESGSSCITKVDPYSGVIASFAEWLGRDLNNKKTRNVVAYSHSKCQKDISDDSKLRRSIDEMTDISIVSVGEDNIAEEWTIL